MAELSLSFVAKRILGLLHSEDIKKMVGSRGRVASQELLGGLEETISEVSPLLLDAEKKSFHDKSVKDLMMALGEALYDADNLLDDLSTASLQHRFMSTRKKMAKLTRQVCRRISKSPVPTSDLQIKGLIKNIKETKAKLDEIASHPCELILLDESSGGKSELLPVPVPVPAGEFHERDDDRKAVVDLLLDQMDFQLQQPQQQEGDHHHVVKVLPIIGMGGIGKTTLAQYVFNDQRVVKIFQERIWVRVSNDFSIRKMVHKVLGETSAARLRSTHDQPELQTNLKRSLHGKRYLIVLDDMWNEDPDLWLQLRDVLRDVGVKGSAIILTSRSLEVAVIAGTMEPYVLGPLTEEKSWTLFQRIAFGGQDSQQSGSSEMIGIGREIVRRCDGHPLLIRVIGTFLCQKEVSDWRTFYEEKFSSVKEFFIEDKLLKQSYDHLSSPLIHCIAYCSLLPKDREINVETLVQLWMAQGFIHPLTSEDQSLEDVGYGYFLNLLDMYFFHQVTRDIRGRVTKCNMHDSMRHLAISAAGEHCLTLDSQSDAEETLRRESHVSFGFNFSSTREVSDSLKGGEKLRSIFFQSSARRADTGRVADKLLDPIISGCRFLRVLDMHALGITNVPSSIGKLKHLRYLDLSENEYITELPDSINELLNLQTLKLSSCFELRKLPRDIGNLINLRHLEIDGCYNLVSLPRGITRLINLQALSQVVLSEDDSTRHQQLEQLGRLKNLRGQLVIKNLKHGKDEIAMHLKEKLGVRSLSLEWEILAPKFDEDGMPLDGELFSDLEELALKGFWGEKLLSPSFPGNLVKLSLRRWVKGKNLSSLSQCLKLKVLVLDEISSLEFVMNDPFSSRTPFFPALQELWLTELRNLRGWWDPILLVNQEYLPSFPCLSKLVIEDCPKLASMPLFPTLEEGLVLDSTCWDTFQLTTKPKSTTNATPFFPASLSWCKTSTSSENQEYSPSFPCHPDLTNEDSPQLAWRRLLPNLEEGLELDSTCRDSFQFNMEHESAASTAELEESSSSPLSKLKSLCIVGIDNFDNSKAKEIAWDTLLSLELLKFDSLPELTTLPMGLRLVSSLKELHIWRSGVAEIPAWIDELKLLEKVVIRACPDLESLPDIKDWRLKTLEIADCPTLTRRCEKKTGADWDKIKHIQDLHVDLERKK